MTPDLSQFVTIDDEGKPKPQPRPETKSWSDVIQVINHWQGDEAGEPVISRFIEMYNLGQQWDWYDDYHAWELAVLAIQEQNANRQPDEDGKLPEPLPLPEAPPQPVPEVPALLHQKALAEIHLDFEIMNRWQQSIANSIQATVTPL